MKRSIHLNVLTDAISHELISALLVLTRLGNFLTTCYRVRLDSKHSGVRGNVLNTDD